MTSYERYQEYEKSLRWKGVHTPSSEDRSYEEILEENCALWDDRIRRGLNDKSFPGMLTCLRQEGQNYNLDMEARFRSAEYEAIRHRKNHVELMNKLRKLETEIIRFNHHDKNFRYVFSSRLGHFKLSYQLAIKRMRSKTQKFQYSRPPHQRGL
jgi:hypothetical protein